MTRGIRGSTALLIVLALGSTVETAHAAHFAIEPATALPGDAVEVVVDLDHEGRSLDFIVEQTLPDGFTFAADERGAPACRRLRFSHALQFALLPEGCEPGVDCTGIRVAGDFRSLDAPGLAPLYGCQVAVPSAADPAVRPLACSATAENISSGQPQTAGCDAGTLAVIDGAALVIGDASAPGGAQTTLAVRLSSSVAVAGFAHDLVLPEDVAVLSDEAGAPRCLLAPSLPAQCGHFEHLPAGCTPGETCTGLRVGLDVPCNTAPIADETVVYVCDVAAADDAEDGEFPITAANVSALDPSGGAVVVLVRDGSALIEASRIVVNAGDAGVRPGEDGRFSVTLDTNQNIAGLEHEIDFEPDAPVAADGAGRPRCTTFAPGREALIRFVPQGCAAGSTCTGINVLFPALGLEPLPRFSTLYQCEVTTAVGVALGSYPLRVSAISATGPSGNALPNAVGDDGAVGVFDEFPGTIRIGSASGAPGERLTFSAMLDTEVEVSGVQNEIGFAAETRIVDRGPSQPTRPSCRALVNRLEGNAFAYRPQGCAPSSQCSGIIALILSLSNVDPIPDDSLLYECDVEIAADAGAGSYPLRVSNVGASDPDGEAVFIGGSDGAVVVTGAPPTPTPTDAPDPTPSATTQPTATRTFGHTPAGDEDDGGCAIGHRPRPASWLLFAGLLLAVYRRRTAQSVWRRRSGALHR